jgi:hypothetical protein
VKRVRGRWAILVCSTCGRVAQFPFCEHRDLPPPEGQTSWYQNVAVTGTWRVPDDWEDS